MSTPAVTISPAGADAAQVTISPVLIAAVTVAAAGPNAARAAIVPA